MSTLKSIEHPAIYKTAARPKPLPWWLSPRWRKVLRDLWHNKTRTILVILSITVGVFSVGMIMGSQLVLVRELNASYAKINPSHANLMTLSPFSEEVAKSVANIPEIAEAEARSGVYARVKTGPDTWQQTQFVALPNFEKIAIDKINSESGKWPPEKYEIVMERTAISMLNAEVGDTVVVKGPNGRERPLRIVGLAHDLYAKLFVLDGVAVGYITPETLKWIGGEDGFLEMRIRVAEHTDDAVYIQKVTDKVQDKIEKAGSQVFFTFVPPPNQHPLNYVVQAISAMLGVLGLMALLLSSFLVINTVSSLMAQQTRQIGLMKAIGAKTSQVVGMYMVTVLIFGVLTLLIALPLGSWGTFKLAQIMGDYFNFDIVGFHMPVAVIILETAVALLVPICASLLPIYSGTKVTVHEAMNDYGVESSYGKGWFDQFLLTSGSKFGLKRPLLMSIRNTFRHKKRLILTLGTLIFSGALFISVATVNDSLLRTVDSMLAYYQYDVAFQFSRPYRNELIQREALQYGEVIAAESWGFYNTRMVYENGTNSGMMLLFAPPAETKLVNPTMLEGRWLRPEDTNALVVNTIFLRDKGDLGVGDEITLKLEGRETKWKIVGIASGGQVVGMAFANYDYLARKIGMVGEADWLMLRTAHHDEATQVAIRDAIQQRFDEMGLKINVTSTIATERSEVEALFQILVVLLFIMTFLLAAVGSFGLAGTMSINVLERRREIGVMRAIGASNRSVLRIFITEGVLIGLISWAVAVLLAWPTSRLISNIIGQQFLNAPLDYAFSVKSVLTWLIAVILLAGFSSFWPAWNASRLTVQNVLAYE